MGIDYETAKRLAISQDDNERRFLAGRTEVQPEILYLLASDRAAEVRRQIAGNTSTPRQADAMLSNDPDEGVRSTLAGKIAALVPTLPPDRVGQLERMTLDILETLARDQAVAVRQVVAETLKDLPNAPHNVIQQLARDLEVSVCGPVLRHSPILTDEDLLDIIQGKPLDGQLVAIAQRAGISGAVTDAIAQTESEGAVAALLSNNSAQIREETLDRIVDMAPRFEPWHGPLVRRPGLPPRAAQRIAGFVNDQLLKVLQARTDLPRETLTAVADAVKQRLAAPKREEPRRKDDNLVDDPVAGDGKERPMDKARRLHVAGKLDEDSIADALTRGDRGFVMAALSVRSGIALQFVDKIVAGQSPRGGDGPVLAGQAVHALRPAGADALGPDHPLGGDEREGRHGLSDDRAGNDLAARVLRGEGVGARRRRGLAPVRRRRW